MTFLSERFLEVKIHTDYILQTHTHIFVCIYVSGSMQDTWSIVTHRFYRTLHLPSKMYSTGEYAFL